jgi:hypothetical protein
MVISVHIWCRVLNEMCSKSFWVGGLCRDCLMHAGTVTRDRDTVATAVQWPLWLRIRCPEPYIYILLQSDKCWPEYRPHLSDRNAWNVSVTFRLPWCSRNDEPWREMHETRSPLHLHAFGCCARRKETRRHHYAGCFLEEGYCIVSCDVLQCGRTYWLHQPCRWRQQGSPERR